ncbi:MAG TPA: hypothetical protein VFU43_04100 [Streptosporangiaceae bacterium]|nr:hypothetical protein [Streptosporangiaceae bacterium]
MEHEPHNPEDREPDNSHPEDLEAGEIDLTGAVQQDEVLRDVIRDALAEAEAAGGELSEWGARAIARTFANTLGVPGALHQFAATGRIGNRDHLLEELAAVNIGASEERHEWTNALGTYITNLPDNASSAEQPAGPRDQQPAPDVPIGGTALEQVSAYLRYAFAEADTRDGVITREDAQAIATLLGGLLPPGSEMDRFAETGDAHPALIHDECETLKQRNLQTPDIDTWIERLERHLASRIDLGRQTAPAAIDEVLPDNPQIEQGLRDHGDAFRAYLQLPDTDPRQADVLTRFHEFYVGAYDSIEALFDAMTDIRACKLEVDAVAERWGLDGFFVIDQERLAAVARAMWDIVEVNGRLYAFSK